MTQLFDEEGKPVAVTVVEAGPCIVTQIREERERERRFVQVGYHQVEGKKLPKPQRALFEKLNLPPVKVLREFRIETPQEVYERGQSLTVGIFNVGDQVDVVGRIKGRGFQGPVKRWGFSGFNETHGTKDKHRAPGSLGGSTFPARVWKNKRMAGRYGNERRTVQNLKVMRIVPEANLIYLSGALPGSRGSLLTIRARKQTGGK